MFPFRDVNSSSRGCRNLATFCLAPVKAAVDAMQELDGAAR